MALGRVVGVVVLYHLGLYFYVDQKIDRVDALAIDGPEVLAPALQAGAETYLVVGSGVPGQTGAASVATLLATGRRGRRARRARQLPADRARRHPGLPHPDGSLRNPATEAFAASLLEGGPACMVRAVQQLSGLRVDHYLGVDLARLPGMVDALGGVPVCVPRRRRATRRRARCRRGSPSCPGRGRRVPGPGDSGADVTGAAVAERAQRLLTSTLRAAMSTGTLTDPLTLTRFLNRAADALTVDEQTTLGDLRVLAGSLGDLCGDAVQRAGLPVAQVGYVPAGHRPGLRPARRRPAPGAVRRDDRGHRRARRSSPRRRRAGGRQHRRGPAGPRRAVPPEAGRAGGRLDGRRRRRSPSTSSTAPRRRGWPPRSPTSCARRASASATVGNEAGHGQPDRRPPRPGRRRAGAHGRRRGARRRAGAQRRDRRHGAAGHRSGLLDGRTRDGRRPDGEQAPGGRRRSRPEPPAPAPVTC